MKNSSREQLELLKQQINKFQVYKTGMKKDTPGSKILQISPPRNFEEFQRNRPNLKSQN
jgi:hypothetical protein